MTMPPGNPPPYGPPPGSQPPPGQPPYGQQPYGQQPYYPPPPPQPYSGPAPSQRPPSNKSNTKWWIIGGLGFLVLVLGVLAAGVLFYFVIGKGTITATDVKQGDCLAEIPEGGRVLTVQTVGCDQPHAGEVFAVLTMPDDDFPGQPAIDEYADRCGPELATYSPASMEDDSVQLYVLYPTEETWKQGDRVVTCVATLDPPRTGSIKG